MRLSLPRLGVGLALAAVLGSSAPSLPPIVLVSRAPLPGGDAVPGLGPHHRVAAPGGRMLVRERDGRLRELVPQVFHDVSDPAVSFDAATIAFAATVHRDSAWRIWSVGVDGRDLRPVTRPGAGRADDFDPCWVGADLLCFASTRDGARAEYADVPVSNLFLVRVSRPGTGPVGEPIRITAERNGAEEPAFDARRGRLVYARWWFNRHRPRPDGSLVTANAGELPGDSVNLWQAIEIDLDGSGARLAAADLSSRRGSMVYQPAISARGVLGVYARNLGLSPRPGPLGIHDLPRRPGTGRHVAGAIVAGEAGDPYSGARGLAAPSACSPAVLPDGRVLFSYAPGGRGDFGLFVTGGRGGRVVPVVDGEGTLELDAAVIARRPAPAPRTLEPAAVSPGDLLPSSWGHLERGRGTFRFHDLDVFAGGDIPRPAPGARIRFFAALAQRGGTGDTAILLRDAPIGPGGEVDVPDLPAAVPLFEQLVSADGRVLMAAHVPAQVLGWNAGVAGRTSRCIGCHVGHSALPGPRDSPPVGDAPAFGLFLGSIG